MNNKVKNTINQINSSDAIILEGAISILSALYSDNSQIVKVILKQGVNNRNTQKVLIAAKTKNIETEFFSPDELQEFEENINNTGLYSLGRTHGGIIAITLKRNFLSPHELLSALTVGRGDSDAPLRPFHAPLLSIAIIEGIEDPYNLGYAARSLYTQGTDALILPERDFGFSESIIEKASTGTFSKMPIADFNADDKLDVINLLKYNKFKIYCIDKKIPANSTAKISDIFDVKFADRTVFIIGGEKRGISKDFLANADEIVRIPYAKKFPHSLAAQTAATIVSYEIHRQKTGGREAPGAP
jgi:23S rRNA (guanosine2251-2'-O)-methyltransferase